MHIRRRFGAAVLGLATLALLPPSASLGAREPEQPVAGQKPPWQRLLNGDDAKKAKELEERIAKLQEAGKFEDALKVAEELAELRGKLQGSDHYEAVNARWNSEALRRILRQEKAVQTEYAEVTGLTHQAEDLVRKGNYKGAVPLRQRALAIRRKALGEDHPDTASSHDALAELDLYLGRFADAEAGFRTALTIRRKVLGEDHPATASCYNDLVKSLDEQGKYAEAEADLRKALAIHRKTLGEDHPDTAISYAGMGLNQFFLGNYAEAEASYRTALAIRRKSLGDDHIGTAEVYNDLARNLNGQGRYTEAEVGIRTSLAICRKSLGEDHPDTAVVYNNLAYTQNKQGKHIEAEASYRTALAIRRKSLGENNLATAIGYNNLAYTQSVQGKYAEAEANYRTALAICRKTLGEGHLRTATSYHGLGNNQFLQGNYAEAQAHFRTALAICRNALGEDNPDTASNYSRLAVNLNAEGKYADAEALWLASAAGFSRFRLRTAKSGLDRATATSERSPLPSLAAVLARNGKPGDAWRRYEEGLARGTWDDLSARLRRPPAKQAEQAELVARLERLDRLVEKATTPGQPSPEQKKRREDLLTQRRQAQDKLDVLARELEAKGPADGQVFDLKDVAAALTPDAALVGWLDLPGAPKAADPDGEHWAFVLRARGEPAVVRLHGTGPGDHWAEADAQLPADLRVALQSPRGDWQPLAERLRKQRLDPLAEQLGARDGLPAVRRLILLPSTALAGVPAEAFADGFTVSYALSGTLYAYLHKQPAVKSTGLLVLADPVFERPAVPELPIPTAPPGGLLLTSVVADGNVAQAGLKAGDVLLRYNGTTLASHADLKPLPESDDVAKRVAVSVWRAGKTLDKELRPGKLDAVLANDPAPLALAAKYEADRWLAKSRGGDDGRWDPLPGTRIEAEGVRKLLAGATPEPLVLADSEASEQRLYDLAKSGDLGKYRYLHLATHGTVDDSFPLRSAIILSRDKLPDPEKQLDAGLPVFDGRLTAEKVLRQWHLNTDMVTLSACQTALGKYEGGEGYVGFAQALILAGSRSVCLSLWKVDDTATALLMGRFYENLLGKREGLKSPLGKADALAEAKSWLRALSREEAAQRAAKMSDGVARGKRPKLPPVSPAEVKEAETREKASTDRDRPYAHPYYWAAFVLIGDPD
jgi:CHAT domain-containing protein/tetratricopeptide (TPR) repeat protein